MILNFFFLPINPISQALEGYLGRFAKYFRDRGYFCENLKYFDTKLSDGYFIWDTFQNI